MSQKVSRKSAVNEDKEKRQTNSPVKEMKKKMAANAEKEKQAAEKATEKVAEKNDKASEKTEKVADKTEKVVEKTAKAVEKTAEKPTEKEKQDKNEKSDKSEKKSEKEKEQKKPEPQAEKSKVDSSKEDKSGKPEKQDAKKPESKKQNGRDRAHNGVVDVTLGTNGTDDVLNGTVSAESEDDDVMLVIDDHDQDELFPELTYDDTSDVESFEPPTPENAPSRSFTRRSQVKATRTPETPRPASDKLADKEADDPKDKVLKLKEDTPATDRKLRSADSPKPQDKKQDKKDSPKKTDGLEKVEESKEENKKDEAEEKAEMEVIVEAEGNEGEELRKTDTNYSKSRVKVSPYRRSMRIADQTNTSVQANYTGNNTTMEMDITESSSFMEEGLDDSSYLRGLRSIRGRSSYKPLKEMALRHVSANRSARSTAAATVSSLESHNRPTGTVVGRKRKPDADDSIELGVEASSSAHGAHHIVSKRMRVLERLAEPFRRVAAAAALPSVARRNADIVGINTDLPLTAPVASNESFDPETLKASLTPAPEPIAVPLAHDERDNKRCVIM